MRSILRNGASIMVLASMCSISAEGGEPAGGGGLAADLAEDAKEAGEGVVSFIQQEGVLIGTAVANAAAWLSSKLGQLTEAAQGVLTSAVQAAQADGGSPGEIVANTLTILYNDAHAIWDGVTAVVKTEVQAVDSSVISAAAAVTTVIPK